MEPLEAIQKAANDTKSMFEHLADSQAIKVHPADAGYLRRLAERLRGPSIIGPRYPLIFVDANQDRGTVEACSEAESKQRKWNKL